MQTRSRTWVKSPVPSDVLSALEELGLDYQVTGDNAKILCPWHEDRKPSCYVHLTSAICHCFSCGAKGQFVKLVKTILGGGWEQASLWCQSRAAGRLRSAQEQEEAPEREHLRKVTEADLALFTDPPSWAMKDRGLALDACRDLGILWDKDNDRWIIPMRDPDGTLVGWQEKGQEHHDELIRPRKVTKPLFGVQEAEGDTAVLVEAPLDVVRLRTVGVAGGVSSFGVSITQHQLALLVTRFTKVISAFDNDEAGREASESLRYFRRMPVLFFNYGDSRAKDVGEMNKAEIIWGIENATRSLVTRF